MTLHRPKPLTTRPSVSVVIPCYNYGRFLPAAVASALDHEGLDVDVLIVDDASTDSSVQTAARLAEDPRVDLLCHETNLGHIRTYNDGLAKVTGDYVVLLSADDQLPRNALSRAVSLMEHHRSVGLVYGYPLPFEKEPPVTPQRVRSWGKWDGHVWAAKLARRGTNVIMSPEVVMRREAWLEVGGYDDRLPHSADLATWLSTALRWDIGRVNGPPQALYRVHGQNMHLTTYAGMLRDLQERALTFDLLFREGRPLPDDAARMERAAARALARTAVRLATEARSEPGGDRAGRDFLELARTTWPPVVDTIAWRRAVVGGPPAGARRSAVRLARRAMDSLAWRRWRRYGV